LCLNGQLVSPKHCTHWAIIQLVSWDQICRYQLTSVSTSSFFLVHVHWLLQAKWVNLKLEGKLWPVFGRLPSLQV
jgi:hypothetical protein